MSNVEIVRLNACFLKVFEVKWVKNDKCTIKDRRNTNVYVHEGYFIENGDFFQKVYTFFERRIFKTTEFLKM